MKAPGLLTNQHTTDNMRSSLRGPLFGTRRCRFRPERPRPGQTWKEQGTSGVRKTSTPLIPGRTVGKRLFRFVGQGMPERGDFGPRTLVETMSDSPCASNG